MFDHILRAFVDKIMYNFTCRIFVFNHFIIFDIFSIKVRNRISFGHSNFAFLKNQFYVLKGLSFQKDLTAILFYAQKFKSFHAKNYLHCMKKMILCNNCYFFWIMVNTVTYCRSQFLVHGSKYV